MAAEDVDVNEELLDYEDEPETEVADAEAANGDAKDGKVKGNYVSIHSSGFRDFLLKPEVLRAIGDCGFEHPSEIQHECIPQVSEINIVIITTHGHNMRHENMMIGAGVWKPGAHVTWLQEEGVLSSPEVKLDTPPVGDSA